MYAYDTSLLLSINWVQLERSSVFVNELDEDEPFASRNSVVLRLQWFHVFSKDRPFEISPTATILNACICLQPNEFDACCRIQSSFIILFLLVPSRAARGCKNATSVLHCSQFFYYLMMSTPVYI